MQALGNPDVNAVSLKIWTSDPYVCFTQVEAQFAVRNISTDTVIFHYVVSALDSATVKEVRALIINPPSQNKYQASRLSRPP